MSDDSFNSLMATALILVVVITGIIVFFVGFFIGRLGLWDLQKKNFGFGLLLPILHSS